MTTISQDELGALLRPYVQQPLEPPAIEKLGIYLELLLKWNDRMSLTSVREPKEIVRRHFGESLFLAEKLRFCDELLDFGTGAGFPGLPIQIVKPGLRVTLAESQQKKVAFLREVTRLLGLDAEVWPKRVESMPAERAFDVITMRAVERSEEMLTVAGAHLRPEGWIAIFRAEESEPLPPAHGGKSHFTYDVPLSRGRLVFVRPG